jgi:tetratricopeptide (TPR) repeat protein
MFTKIWRWLKKLLQRLFSGSKAKYKLKTTPESLPLTDLDYEFLFNQLLVGIGHGWQEGRIVRFFEQLNDRSREKDWIQWLDRFQAKIMPNAANNQQLGAIMMRFGEQVQSVASLAELGDKSYQIGRAILTYQAPSEIWEYAGPDATLTQTEALADLNTPPKNSATATEWFELGLQQAEAGLLAEAIASWDEALKIDPLLDFVWHNRGAAFGQLGKFVEAIACFDEALKIKPEAVETLQDKAFSLYQLEQWEQALASWDQLLQLVPDNYQGWYNRGCVLEFLDQDEQAIASYEKALEIQPDFEPALTRIKTKQEIRKTKTD